MKRARRRRRATAGGDRDSLVTLISRDGAMRSLVAIGGMLVGIIATHIDLGRRVDAMTAQVQALTSRLESMEHTVNRSNVREK